MIKPDDEGEGAESPDTENFFTASLGYAFWLDQLMIAPELIVLQPLGDMSTGVDNEVDPQWTITPMLNLAGQF